MFFHLIHIDTTPRTDPGEEAYVITPGTSKTAMAVPLDALPAFLPMLAEALDDLPPLCCPQCGEPAHDVGDAHVASR